MSRILITGGGGFTAPYVEAELTEAGWEVFSAGVSGSNGKSNYFQMDLCDQATVSRVIDKIQPNAVIHLAGIAFVGASDAEAFYRVNLIGTRHLLQALSECKARLESVVLASSANVYGNSRSGTLDELAPPEPANDYAVSKLAMEHMARLWMDRLPVAIVRPFNYTGVGQNASFLVPKIVDHYRRRAPEIELGNIDVSRDFSDVRSVAVIYRRLVDDCPVGKILNICSGHAISLRDILRMATEITGHSPEVKINPAFVRENEIKTLKGDPARLIEHLGKWEGISFRQTLEWMLNS